MSFVSPLATPRQHRKPAAWFFAVLSLWFTWGSVQSVAAPLYWDLNGDVAGSGSATPSGVWDLVTQNWNITATGDTTAPGLWNNGGTETAVFAAGTDATGSYIVTVDGTILLTGLTVEEGGALTLAQGAGGSLNFGSVQAQINVTSGATLEANLDVAGTAGLLKTGSGTFSLNGGTTPSGAFVINAGTLTVGNGVAINGTTLSLGGTAGVSSTLSLGTGSVFHLGGAISFVNANTPLAALIQGGTLTLNGTRTISVQNISAEPDIEIRSVIADGTAASGINKTLGGTLLLSRTNTYTGTTTVTTGTLLLQGNEASIATSSAVVVGGGATFTVGASTDTLSVDRLGNTASITLSGTSNNGAANFNYNGSDFAVQTVQVENAGALVFAGDSRSFVSLKAGAGDELELRLASLSRQGSALGLLRADNLGLAAGSANSVRVYVNEPLALFGSAGGILPWLVGDNTVAGSGTGFLNYDPTVGLRFLNAGESSVVSSSLVAGANALKSVAGAVSITSSARVNSWSTTSTGVVTLASGVTVGIDSGGLLFTANGTFTDGILDLSSYSKGAVHLAGGVAVTAVINSTLAGDSGFSFNGTGSGNKILALAGNNTITGGVTVLQGILELRSQGALNASGVNALNLLGGTLRLNGNSVTIASLDGAGAVINNHASVASTLTINGGGTFAGTINNGAAGTVSLVKKGGAALILGGANGYTGTTVVEEGILHVNQNGANPGTNGSLSATTAILVKQGGTLRINNGNAANNNGNRVNDAAPITLSGGTLTFVTSATAGVSYSESVGALFLEAGANILTTQPSAASTTSTFTLANFGGRTAGATLNFGGGSLGTTQNKVVFTAGINAGFVGGWATSGNDFAKYVAGTGIIAMSGADYVSTAANNATTPWSSTVHAKPTVATQTLTASYQVASLNLGAVASDGVDIDLGSNTLTVVSGGIIKSAGSADGTGTNLSVISGTGSLTAGAGDVPAELFFRVTGANLRINARVEDHGTGAVSVVKSGAGTVELNGTNGYTGHTYFNEGTILIGGVDALGVGGQLIFNGGKLKYAAAATSFDASARNNLFVGDAIIDTQGLVVTFANAIGGGGSGRFTKAGSGTLNIASTTNAFNYLGVTRVTEGILRFTGTSAVHQVHGLILGGGTTNAIVDVMAGNLLNLDGDIIFNTDTDAESSAILSGTVALNGSRTIQIGDVGGIANATNELRLRSTLVDGTVAASRLYKSGSGVLYLLADNSFTGRAEVWEGTLAVLDLEALGLPSVGEENVLILGKGATAGAFSYQGLDDVTSNRAILLNGETGGGVLLGDDEGALTWAGDVSVTQTGAKTLTLGGIAESWVQNEVAGVISDNPAVQARVSVVKTGSATWRLTGQNTYRGTTSVQQGTLQVGHGGDGSTLAQARTAGTTGTGRTTLGSGGVLSGSGVIQTGLTIQGGELRPGDSSLATEETPFVAGGQVGTLWADGDVAFESGTLIFQVQSATIHVAGLADPAVSGFSAALAGLPASHATELSAAVNQSGVQHDHLEITGSFNAAATGPQTLQIVALEGATFAAGDVFNLVDWAGLVGPSAFPVAPTFVLPDLSASHLAWDTSLFATDGILVVTAAPEPARGLLLMGGLGLVLLRRRRARHVSPR